MKGCKMNISPVNSSKANFGKISWGTPEKAQETASALRTLKEANEIHGKKHLKYTDVVKQLEILSNHPDTFEVGCSIIDGYADSSFDINVFELTGEKKHIARFSQYYTADYKLKPSKEIKSFAQKVLSKHQSISGNSPVEILMNRLGQIKK